MKRLIILLSVMPVFISSIAQSRSFFETGSIYPAHEIVPKTIALSNGINLEYVEKGNKDATAVIFLHGYSDSWHSFEIVLNMLPLEMHLIALSLRGHGNSSKPNEGYHPKDFAGDLSLFITEKKLGASIIVGHSLGGYVTQQFAHQLS